MNSQYFQYIDPHFSLYTRDTFGFNHYVCPNIIKYYDQYKKEKENNLNGMNIPIVKNIPSIPSIPSIPIVPIIPIVKNIQNIPITDLNTFAEEYIPGKQWSPRLVSSSPISSPVPSPRTSPGISPNISPNISPRRHYYRKK